MTTPYPRENFQLNLPIFNEDTPTTMHYRHLMRIMNAMDTPYGLILPNSTTTPLQSVLKNSQTPRIFFATIDQTLIANGVDLDEVRRLIEIEGPLDDLFKLVAPTYVALVNLGYNEYPDLIG
jgi:hypothetical protein